MSEVTDKEKLALIAKHGGLKFSKGKVRLALMFRGFAPALWEMGVVATKGALKYADNSWQTVAGALDLYEDALERHVLAWQSGEDFDPEFKTHHLAHAAWNCLAILTILFINGSVVEYKKRNPEEDGIHLSVKTGENK